MQFYAGPYRLEDVINNGSAMWWSAPDRQTSTKAWLLWNFGKTDTMEDILQSCKSDSDEFILQGNMFPEVNVEIDINIPSLFDTKNFDNRSLFVLDLASRLDFIRVLKGCAWRYLSPPASRKERIHVAHLRTGDIAYGMTETRDIVQLTGNDKTGINAARIALSCIENTLSPPCRVFFVSDSRDARMFAKDQYQGKCNVSITKAIDARMNLNLEQTRDMWNDFVVMSSASHIVYTQSALSEAAADIFLDSTRHRWRLENEIQSNKMCRIYNESHHPDLDFDGRLRLLLEG